VRYFRDAAAAFERLGVAAAAIEALRSAIAAEQGLEDYDGDLLQQHVPELFEQWSSQPDPAARGRVTDRIETVMELLYVADGRDLTDEDDSALYAYELAQSGEDQQVIAREVQRYRAELMRSYDRALDESSTARTQAAQLNQPLTPDELAGRPAVTPPWTATATPQPYERVLCAVVTDIKTRAFDLLTV
jgi:hypothetical protein